MAQTTTNYGLLKPESTDSYNHLIYDNPNMDTIDAAMKANSDAAITSATCIKSGTTHTITRSNTSAAVMRFTATGDWNTGDTMIIDGVTVSPYLMTGEALKTGAYLINSEVMIALSGTRATVLSNQSEAGTTYFDDTNVSFTANNVQTAIEELNDAANIEYAAGVSVTQKIDSLDGRYIPIGGTGTITSTLLDSYYQNTLTKIGYLQDTGLPFYGVWGTLINQADSVGGTNICNQILICPSGIAFRHYENAWGTWKKVAFS